MESIFTGTPPPRPRGALVSLPFPRYFCPSLSPKDDNFELRPSLDAIDAGLERPELTEGAPAGVERLCDVNDAHPEIALSVLLGRKEEVNLFSVCFFSVFSIFFSTTFLLRAPRAAMAVAQGSWIGMKDDRDMYFVFGKPGCCVQCCKEPLRSEEGGIDGEAGP